MDCAYVDCASVDCVYVIWAFVDCANVDGANVDCGLVFMVYTQAVCADVYTVLVFIWQTWILIMRLYYFRLLM